MLRNIFNLLRQDKKTALQQMHESGTLLWHDLLAAEFSQNNKTPGAINTPNVDEFLKTLQALIDYSGYDLDWRPTLRLLDDPNVGETGYLEIFFGKRKEILLLRDAGDFDKTPVLKFHVYPDDMMEVTVISSEKIEGGKLINTNSIAPAIAISDYLREVYPREKIESLERVVNNKLSGMKMERHP